MSLTRVKNITSDVTVDGTTKVSNRLQVGDASITQQYPALGYIADFQASSGSQTFISIAEPGASTLGNTGVVIGEDTTNTYITQRGNKPINIATSDTNQIIIDGSGRVTKPNQPMFQVNLSASKTISGSATIEITGWDISQGGYHNTGSHFNLTSGRFTAPVAGKYKFDANVMHGYTTGDYQVHLRINGSSSAAVKANDMHPNSGAAWQQTSVTALFNLSVNDYVSLFIFNSATMSYAAYGNSTGHCFTTINGYLVG
tara:strand:+ start:1252 stop:2022 length:771 start_codon:yes stop_codon:yes gene_type:complete